MIFVKNSRGGREVNMINTLSKINLSKVNLSKINLSKIGGDNNNVFKYTGFF